jgi:hypothetical protein
MKSIISFGTSEGKGTAGDFSVSYFHYIARPSEDITSFFSVQKICHIAVHVHIRRNTVSGENI